MRGGTSTMQFCMAKQDSMFHQWWAVRIQSTVSLSGTVETSFSYTMKLFSMRTHSCSIKLSQAWKIMLTWLLAAVAFPVWTSVQQNIVGVVLLAFVLIWQTQGLNLTWIWLILKHWLFLLNTRCWQNCSMLCPARQYTYTGLSISERTLPRVKHSWLIW